MQYVAAALCTNRFVHKCMFDKPCFRQWGCSDLRDVRILHKKSFSILFFHVHLNFEASISIFENLNQVKMTPQWYWRVIYDIKRKNLKWTNFEIFHQNQDFFSFSIHGYFCVRIVINCHILAPRGDGIISVQPLSPMSHLQ